MTITEITWDIQRIAKLISVGAIYGVLNEELQATVAALTANDMVDKIQGTIGYPSRFTQPFWALVLAAQYYALFEVLDLPKAHAVYEPGAGAEPPVLIASTAFGEGRSRYTTINLNQQLHAKLMNALQDRSLNHRIIADNAQAAFDYLEPSTIDIACFNHSINDILQTAVAEAKGMDTAIVDWFAEERQMIEWLDAAFRSNTIETVGKKELLQIIGDTATLVRSGGYLIFFHCVFEGMQELTWFPWEFYSDLIPITRNWIRASTLPLEEVYLPNIDPRWWMILKVK